MYAVNSKIKRSRRPSHNIVYAYDKHYHNYFLRTSAVTTVDIPRIPVFLVYVFNHLWDENRRFYCLIPERVCNNLVLKI